MGELMADLEFVRACIDDLNILTNNTWGKSPRSIENRHPKITNCRSQNPCQEIFLWQNRMRMPWILDYQRWSPTCSQKSTSYL